MACLTASARGLAIAAPRRITSKPALRLVAQPRCAIHRVQHGVGRNRTPVVAALPHHPEAPAAETAPVVKTIPQQVLAFFARGAAMLSVATAMVLLTAGNAFAAQSGGRVGGSNFSGHKTSRSMARSESRSYQPTQVHTHSTTVIHTSTPSYGWGFMPSVFMPVAPVYGVYSGTRTLMTILTLVLLVTMAVALFRMFSNKNEEVYEEEYDAEPPVTIAKVQVGVLAVAKSLKHELDLLAARANTSSPEGLHYVLQETVLALMRNPDFCIYGHSSRSTVADPEEAERAFGRLSLEERGRIKQETLSNVGGFSRQSSVSGMSRNVNELMVVTLMVAAEGDFQVPPIKSHSDLKLALSKLGSVSPDNLMAVEVLWTPQADNDTLTRDEVMMEFPQLLPL